MDIRNMSNQDIEFAVRLVNEEQWGYSAMEFERILALDPAGSFLAVESGEPLGLVTTSSYGRTGSIGHIVVVRERRRSAVGTSLMKRALEHLDALGLDSVVLNAVPAATRFYERFGFRNTRPMRISKLKFEEDTKAGLRASCPALQERDLPAAIALDSRLFGDDRHKILSRLFVEFPEHAFKFEREGRLSGFILGRRTPVGSDVGPWICHPCVKEVAVSLLSSLFSTFSPGYVHIATFTASDVANDAVQRLGTMQSADTLLMIRGERRYVGHEGSVLGIAAPEFG